QQQHQMQQAQQQHQQQQHQQHMPHTQQQQQQQGPPHPPAGGQPGLAVDSEFMHCYNDIQLLYHQQRVEDPIMHLSQDWMGYIHAEPAGGYVTNAHLPPPPQHGHGQGQGQGQGQGRPFIPSQRATFQPPPPQPHTRM
ncbi:hypothetical protein LTR53_017543, partial [Teratosphaeriaceae sp. CCFEE 6253]